MAMVRAIMAMVRVIMAMVRVIMAMVRYMVYRVTISHGVAAKRDISKDLVVRALVSKVIVLALKAAQVRLEVRHQPGGLFQ